MPTTPQDTSLDTLTTQERIDRVASRLTGEFYIGQRVLAGWPFPLRGEIVGITASAIVVKHNGDTDGQIILHHDRAQVKAL